MDLRPRDRVFLLQNFIVHPVAGQSSVPIYSSRWPVSTPTELATNAAAALNTGGHGFSISGWALTVRTRVPNLDPQSERYNRLSTKIVPPTAAFFSLRRSTCSERSMTNRCLEASSRT